MVIAIIAILAAMLLPALANAKEKGKQAYCINSLKQLNIVFHMYEDDNDGYLHHTTGGGPPNHGKWYMNPRMRAARKLIPDPNSGEAYWGLAYYKYAGGNTRLWRCPAAKTSDEWREDGLRYGADFWLDASYGINGQFFSAKQFRGTRGSHPRKRTQLIDANQTIIIQDSGEQKMDGGPSDNMDAAGGAENLIQWKYSLAPLYPDIDWVSEWFRHGSNKTLRCVQPNTMGRWPFQSGTLYQGLRQNPTTGRRPGFHDEHPLVHGTAALAPSTIPRR